MENKPEFKLGAGGFAALSLLIWGLLTGIVTDSPHEWLGWMLLYLTSEILLFLLLWTLALSAMKKEKK